MGVLFFFHIYRNSRNLLVPNILCMIPQIGLDAPWKRKPPWLMTIWNSMICWVN